MSISRMHSRLDVLPMMERARSPEIEGTNVLWVELSKCQ
jgi:hypothetical protein